MGVSLGIALRLLSSMEDEPLGSQPSASHNRWLVNIGVILNMLEPPAIIAALGLGLGRQSCSLSDTSIWQAFGLLVMPALLIAAVGEALWIGEYFGRPESARSDTPDLGDQYHSS